MVEIPNSYFSSVYTMERLENITDHRIMFNGEHMLEEVDLTTKGGMNKLQELNSEKSPRNDSIHPAVLKNIRGTVAHPSSLMFRMNLETGEVPQDWKMANVKPIFKGSKKFTSNYRLASLTSVVSKVMESLIKDAVLRHLMDHQLIKGTQHRFIPSKSCSTNLPIFLKRVTSHIDSGSTVDVIYLDFLKAFNKVPHETIDEGKDTWNWRQHSQMDWQVTKA